MDPALPFCAMAQKQYARHFLTTSLSYSPLRRSAHVIAPHLVFGAQLGGLQRGALRRQLPKVQVGRQVRHGLRVVGVVALGAEDRHALLAQEAPRPIQRLHGQTRWLAQRPKSQPTQPYYFRLHSSSVAVHSN